MTETKLKIEWQINLSDEEHILLCRLLSPFPDSAIAQSIYNKVHNAEIVYVEK